jgi:hypothetical protein
MGKVFVCGRELVSNCWRTYFRGESFRMYSSLNEERESFECGISLHKVFSERDDGDCLKVGKGRDA